LQSSRPQILDKYQIDKIPTKLTVLGQYDYTIKTAFDQVEKATGNLKSGSINLILPDHIDIYHQRKLVRNLSSKLVAKTFKPLVVDKVEKLNYRYFQKEIKGISLRYNSTNWGSCSAKGRINLSTRSLLLPEETFDYILVHELSHLIEMNHSKRFWQIVEQVIPTYKKHEAYIKTHSAKIDF
jgi:predicted metal-dependent hydrolase